MTFSRLAFGITTFLTLGTLSVQAAPRGRGAVSSISGSHSIGFNASTISPSQGDVNSWVTSVNKTGTSQLGSGYEFSLDYEYRIDGTIFAIMLRPSYFTQKADGGGVEAKLSGYTVFPTLRLYALENDFIKFFMQVGVGYGSLTTELKNDTASGKFDGSAFGGMGGIGVLFCITGSQCISVEGNARYLPIERNTGTASGTLGGNITQTAGELEQNSKDLGTTMSGIQGQLGYKIMF